MKSKITKDEYEALANFRYALRQFLRFSEQAAKEAGLTPQQHQALLAIRGYPGRERVTIGELAERLQVLHHSAVGLVDRLSGQGLLQREQDTADRRVVYVSLTPLGEEMIARITAAHRQEMRRISPQLSEALQALQDGAGK
jgi:DNA-binding MarR family transcriptional regulator